jgi:anti-sigma B factor antagonist
VKIESSVNDNIVIIKLRGKLMGGPDMEPFMSEVEKYLTQGFKKFIIDLAEVDWIDSTGLGVLINRDIAIRKEKGHLILTGIGEKLRSLFTITLAGSVFSFFESTAEAIDFYKKGDNL